MAQVKTNTHITFLNVRSGRICQRRLYRGAVEARGTTYREHPHWLCSGEPCRVRLVAGPRGTLRARYWYASRVPGKSWVVVYPCGEGAEPYPLLLSDFQIEEVPSGEPESRTSVMPGWAT